MMFLDSPISHLKLEECYTGFFETILKEMENHHLKRLEISKCLFLTFDHVVKILLKFVNLKYLLIHHCFSLSQEEKQRIETYIRQSKIDLVIDLFK